MSATSTMRPSLFRSGLAPRLGAAVLYGVVAFGAVALLAPADSLQRSAPTAPATPPAAEPSVVRIDSLRPVAAWDVRIDGRAATALRSDAHAWIGRLPVGPEATLVIDAEPAGPAEDARNALRIRIAGTPVSHDQTFWCERDWSITAQAARLAPAPAPIDPEDLP